MRHRFVPVIFAAVLFAACDTAPEDRARASGAQADASPPPVLVEDATAAITGRLFLSAQGEVVERGVVVLASDRVACAGELEACHWPEGTPEHAFPDHTILPGLIDLHVHARPHYAGAFLPAGVTTIRDPNNTLGTVEALRATKGAPRMLASGPLLDGPNAFFAQLPGAAPGHPDEDPTEEIMPVVVTSPEEAASAVQALADAGVDLVKLYEQLPPDAFHAAVDAAHGLGLPVATDLGMAFTRGLSGAAVDIVEAAEAGVTTIEHLSGLALAYQRRGGDPFAERVDEAIIREIAEALLDSGVAFVPTVATALRMEDESVFPADGLPGVEEMTPVLDGQWDMTRAFAAQRREAAGADSRLVRALLPRLITGGAPLGVGSDLPAAPGMYPGWGLHQELEALVHLGLTPTEALRAATVVAADLAGRDDIGELSAGAHADLVVVAGDPTREITDSRRIEAVWSGGEPVELDLAWERVAEAMEAAAAAFGG
jgi:imidazolonepropionase-like amidohydrolase